jgi:quercetin dioxygenase-like cupin family protein
MNEVLVSHESDVDPETWSDPLRGRVVFRTLVGDSSQQTDLTAGVAELQPDGWLGRHRHVPAEIYHVLTGEGLLVVAGEEHLVSAGATVYIPGNGEHEIRNIGDSVLRFFYVLDAGAMEDVSYEFSAERQ